MTDLQNIETKKAKFIEIDAEREGQRIDNFLVSQLKGAPKSLVYKILRTGQVRVNKGRIKQSYRLKIGDIVRIPPLRMPEKIVSDSPGQTLLDRIERSVIYEDAELIVLNKPSGIAVHGGSGINFGVIEAIRALRPNAKHLELVHRLDRDTSGCLLISKKRSALRRLHELLREGGMDKKYLALCKGKWKGGPRKVEAPLKKNVLSSGERIVRVSSDGKSASTLFTPKQRFKAATLMEVELYTGRTHQIRVHAEHEGQPLAGDDKYGDKDFNQFMRQFGLKRLFLHAYSLRFPWLDDQIFEVKAPMDEALEVVLKRLS